MVLEFKFKVTRAAIRMSDCTSATGENKDSKIPKECPDFIPTYPKVSPFLNSETHLLFRNDPSDAKASPLAGKRKRLPRSGKPQLKRWLRGSNSIGEAKEFV